MHTQELLMGTETVQNGPVKISLPGLLHHTLIVGQSGSGKSFFVARLIEEILLRTGARVVALDPNGDLRHLEEPDMGTMLDRRIETNKAAKKAGLEQLDDQIQFSSSWEKQRIVFLNSAERHPNVQIAQRVERRRLVLDWATMDDEQDALLELDSHLRPAQLLGVNACRDLVAFAQGGTTPLRLPDSLRGLADAADLFARQNVSMIHYDYAKHLQPSDWSNVRARFLDLISRHRIWAESAISADRSARVSLTDLIDAAFEPAALIPEWNSLVIGLDAARQPDVLLTASVALGRLWKDAKDQTRRAASDGEQVPTFIVIDEAHNFAPAKTDDPLRRRVSDRILQIASEGRKYGLYLILATQRPTKLNPELVPECENSCVLRVQSERELQFAAETLGIPTDRVGGAARFTQGQGLLTGRWVDGNVVDVLAAPARTRVGGGGLSTEWMEGPRHINYSPDSFDSTDALASAENRVRRILASSATAPLLVTIANELKSDPELLCGPENSWMGAGGLKELLLMMSIEGLVIDSRIPGYVYLEGVHPEPAHPEADEIKPPTPLQKVRKFVDVPVLSAPKYHAVFEALSDELAVNPFRFTDTNKTVRDALQQAGTEVGRAAIGFILRGIQIGGHDFSADKPQDPNTLANSFLKSLIRVTASEAELTEAEAEELKAWFYGAVDVPELADSRPIDPQSVKTPLEVEASRALRND